ncbi:MAG: HAMP domain-containing histidine kinase [Phormidesmis sp. RL_2_1]|nr:HAMP domain-containing histidine kinase [Phormidesmis sp. RL_2_1]
MIRHEKMASLGNLVAGVAHEINNPVGFLNGSIENAQEYIQDLLGHLNLYQQHHPQAAAAIQANAQAIDLDFLRNDLPELLQSMQGATDRIASISDSLRIFSRADTQHKVSADLNEGLNSTLLILKYRLKANQHRPAIAVIQNYGELPPVDCFPGQLNQVFMNILANAIDAFDEAAGHSTFEALEDNPQQITITTVALADQNTVDIRIQDNGKGMSDDIKAKIFDHLFTTKGVGKGTGLGLAIARQIVVETHGGSLDVHAELGQGTEFSIQLPIQG